MFILRQKAKKTHWKEALSFHHWSQSDKEILTIRPHHILKADWLLVSPCPQSQLNVPIIQTSLLKVCLLLSSINLFFFFNVKGPVLIILCYTSICHIAARMIFKKQISSVFFYGFT